MSSISQYIVDKHNQYPGYDVFKSKHVHFFPMNVAFL